MLPTRVRISSQNIVVGGSPSLMKADPIIPTNKKGSRIKASNKKTSISKKISGGKIIRPFFQ